MMTSGYAFFFLNSSRLPSPLGTTRNARRFPRIRNDQMGDYMQPRWACETSTLPDSVYLGTVEVSCEGYSSRDDPYVLVGSCSLTYALDRTASG